MIEPLLKKHLEPVARRHRRLLFRRGLARCWGLAALAAVAVLLAQWSGLDIPALLKWALALGAVVGAFVVWNRALNWNPDYRDIARRIEGQHPDLHALLLTAVEQKPQPETGRLNFLQERVVREAIEASQKHRWINTVSDSQLFTAQAGQLAALAIFVLAWLALQPAAGPRAERAAETPPAKPVLTVEVTPGDVSVERGSGLVVLARFSGPLPADATLVVGNDSNSVRRIALVKNLNDPVFGGSIPEVNSNLAYRIEYSTGQTREFQVTVFEHPRLERADATVKYPDYTGLAEKRINDTRRVSALEGSRLQWDLQLNKPVKTAKLVARDSTEIALEVSTNLALATLQDFAIVTNRTFELQLVDHEGRTNKVPAHFVVEALRNRPPELKVYNPRGDTRVSPIEEIVFQAEAWDDFGLRGWGLSYTLAGSEPKSITLGTNAGPNEKRGLTNQVDLEALRVQPDQLLSWFVWAEDIGPDGQLRRVSSDMFFAEVRPFEEIYREAQTAEAPPGDEQQQQQGQGNDSAKLAELQKQIINATWKLQRQHGGKNATEPYKKDATVVEQSQSSALEQAEALQERVEDPRLQGHVQDVVKKMKEAVEQLTKATDSTAALPPSLDAEQSAYQALLKLSAREYQVMKSKRQQGQGQAQQRNQGQLDQLDLKQNEDRYEKQSQAQTQKQQTPEQREQLAVLNRLKELAQRQENLNEKIKELQMLVRVVGADGVKQSLILVILQR